MAPKPSLKQSTYEAIRRRGNLVKTERSSDYTMRREHWKHGNVIYNVLIKVNPCNDRVLRITGRVISGGAGSPYAC